jgi:dihydrofolate reductase
MIVSIVVAISENNAIGKNNQLLWHLPEDLKFFKRVTSGHSIIMGRKTYESIGRPLPNRRNIVISRQNLVIEGCEVVPSLDKALEITAAEEEVFIVGGGQIYVESLERCDRLYLTRVHTHIEDADTFFPTINPENWKILSEEHHTADEKHLYDYTFLVMERVS